MKLALRLARRGEGLVEPNPMVGCVIVSKCRTIGKGYHRRFGGAHAEVAALRACTESPNGATVYCTLEPCSHTGKTPPCVNALIEAKVARVVIASIDPNPQVNGNGVALLRGAGIKVDSGLFEQEARGLLRPFATRQILGRPYVIAKWAQSLNGQLVTDPSDSRWISCESSRVEVHRLRSRVDAILVGANTVLCDDPLLTARDVPLRRVAMRWVLDGRLRTPVASRLIRTACRFPTFIFTTNEFTRSRKAGALRRAGTEVVSFKSRRGRIDIGEILRGDLFASVTNLLVEGGPTLLNQFFAEELVDEAIVYTAPRLLPVAGRTVQFGTTEPAELSSQACGCDMRYTLIYERLGRGRSPDQSG